MYQPRHDYRDILADLESNGVDMTDFRSRWENLCKMGLHQQLAFEFLWSTYKLNNYKI